LLDTLYSLIVISVGESPEKELNEMPLILYPPGPVIAHAWPLMDQKQGQ